MQSIERPGPVTRWGRVVAVAALAAGGLACGSDDDATGDDGAESDDPAVATTEGSDGPATTGPGSTEGESQADTGSNDIAIVSVAEGFQPSGLTVSVGAEVVWTNVDALTHTTTADDGTWDSGDLGVSQSFSFVPAEPGTYAYFCAIHPSMVGELVVE